MVRFDILFTAGDRRTYREGYEVDMQYYRKRTGIEDLTVEEIVEHMVYMELIGEDMDTDAYRGIEVIDNRVPQERHSDGNCLRRLQRKGHTRISMDDISEDCACFSFEESTHLQRIVNTTPFRRELYRLAFTYSLSMSRSASYDRGGLHTSLSNHCRLHRNDVERIVHDTAVENNKRELLQFYDEHNIPFFRNYVFSQDEDQSFQSDAEREFVIRLFHNFTSILCLELLKEVDKTFQNVQVSLHVRTHQFFRYDIPPISGI